MRPSPRQNRSFVEIAMPRDVLALLLLASLALGGAAPEAVEPRVPRAGRRGPQPLVLASVTGAAGLIATPAVRRAVRKFLKPAELPEGGAPPAESLPKRTADPPPPAAAETEAGAEAEEDEADKFMLTPERLAAIASINPQLEKVGAQLSAVPVFTAAVGNGTSPLTVPGEDGQKLAYFFTESADAEAFLEAVVEQTGSQLQAQVIAVSLSNIIQGYANPAAVAAKETFVLIPTMAEVGAARSLLQAMKVPPPKANQLGPGNGLVPIFWSEELAVQSADGKQRKVLFFRLADLQAMWKNLTDTRQLAGETDIPARPVVHVSSLQMMATALNEANKTDEAIFLPSSTALRSAQAAAGRPATNHRSTPSMASPPAPRDGIASMDAAMNVDDVDFSDSLEDDDGDDSEDEEM
ncbi:hypothetical protein AB1Y20_023300 [Prymnesium parvum]|uniref:Uncharacterized protein n=1 Tax=Prymnesium parvum TaxID=97485 RepID=A0AB34JFT6_PRYPA